jgi:hypothetical protein
VQTKDNTDDEKAVDLGKFVAADEEAADAAPDLTAIRRFVPTGDRDDRLTVMVPVFVRRALDTLVIAVRRTTVTTAALWALSRGLARVQNLPEVTTVCDAHAVLLQTGSPDISQLDLWHYQVAARGGQTRLFLRSVSPADAGKCAELARGLGLPTGTLGALVIMAGLVDTPLPGDLPRLLMTELREFYRGLRQRAALADELHKRANAIPQNSRSRYSWRDVLAED